MDSDRPQLVFNFCEPGLVYLLNGDNKSNLMGTYKMCIKYLVLSVRGVGSYGSCDCHGYWLTNIDLEMTVETINVNGEYIRESKDLLTTVENS